MLNVTCGKSVGWADVRGRVLPRDWRSTEQVPCVKGIARLLEMLVYAQDDRLYKNDVLYIQSADDDYVPALLDLAKQWQADDCEGRGARVGSVSSEFSLDALHTTRNMQSAL